MVCVYAAIFFPAILLIEMIVRMREREGQRARDRQRLMSFHFIFFSFFLLCAADLLCSVFFSSVVCDILCMFPLSLLYYSVLFLRRTRYNAKSHRLHFSQCTWMRWTEQTRYYSLYVHKIVCLKYLQTENSKLSVVAVVIIVDIDNGSDNDNDEKRVCMKWTM